VNIKIYDLHPAGFDLLQDSESFLGDLTDNEIRNIKGGNWILDFNKFLRVSSFKSIDFQGYQHYKAATLQGVQRNSVANNTYNNNGINAVSFSNANTVAGV
jgi:hypothetical protein